MRIILTVFLASISMTALAGKAERDYLKNEVLPAVAEAEAAFKKACGCALKIKVGESFKTTDEMYRAKHIAESVKDGAAGHCTDADSKRAVCTMKTLKIELTKEAKFSFAGSVGTATTDGQVHTSFDMMTKELDK